MPTWISNINRVYCGKFRVLCVLEKEAFCCFVLWYLCIAIWNSERGLLLLGFGSAGWLFALSLCVATFGFDLWLSLWFVHNSHLVFSIRIWYLWTFSSLVLYLWERAIWVFLEFRFVRVPLHQFLLSQICYSEIFSSSPIDIGYC